MVDVLQPVVGAPNGAYGEECTEGPVDGGVPGSANKRGLQQDTAAGGP